MLVSKNFIFYLFLKFKLCFNLFGLRIKSWKLEKKTLFFHYSSSLFHCHTYFPPQEKKCDHFSTFHSISKFFISFSLSFYFYLAFFILFSFIILRRWMFFLFLYVMSSATCLSQHFFFFFFVQCFTSMLLTKSFLFFFPFFSF